MKDLSQSDPSLPPTGGVPEEIEKAIEEFDNAAQIWGEEQHEIRGRETLAVIAGYESARSILDATISRHLSTAIARAERAEKALGSLLDGIMIDGGDPEVTPDPGLEDRILASPDPDVAEWFGVRPTIGVLDLCQRIVAGRAALSQGEEA